jgi:SanA protein
MRLFTRFFSFIRSKFLVLGITALWLFFSALFLSDYLVKKASETYLYNELSAVSKHRVGVMLGTSKYLQNNTINLYYKYRIDAAVKLFEAGKIEFILVSGDNRFKNYNEPKQMQKDLIARGVPKERIFLDYAGFRTLDSMVRANKVFQLTEFIVISQKFHNERAVYIARKKGINAIAFNAQDVTKKYGLKTKIRERFARVKVVLDMIINKKPKFLGEVIDIK